MSCDTMVEVFDSDDIWRFFEPTWVDQLSVRPIYPTLGDPNDVDWFEAEEYFTQGSDSLIANVVKSLNRTFEEVVEGVKTFEYLLVGCTSTMDTDVGQAYTFTLMSFPILKVVLQHQSETVLGSMERTMELPPAYVDPTTAEVDYSGSAMSYSPKAVHFAPTMSVRPPMGNGISFACGIYALPRSMKEALVNATELHSGLINL